MMDYFFSDTVGQVIMIGLTALLSALIGGKISTYLNRAKPLCTIIAIRKADENDLVPLYITIPVEALKILRSDPWIPNLRQKINAARITKIIETQREAISVSRSSIDYVKTMQQKLEVVANGSPSEKINFLDDLTENEHAIIMSSMIGSLVRRELVLPQLTDEQFAELEKLVDYFEVEGGTGYELDLHKSCATFDYKRRRDNKHILPGVKAFAYFHKESIRAILDHVLQDLKDLAATGETSLGLLENLCSENIPLVVECRVTNSGRSPILFSPWASLRIEDLNDSGKLIEVQMKRSSDTWKPLDPISAQKQKSELMNRSEFPFSRVGCFVVDGGKSVDVVYHSIRALDLIKSDSEFALNKALEYGGLSCMIKCKRADIDGSENSWIDSKVTRFESSEEGFPRN